ncbi:MAG TPA: threonine ammonia-lyase, partial [Acidimicrobiales bacterium]|nr:threonine ammonia-lyase [Acidimicrobiales bacterium]
MIELEDLLSARERVKEVIRPTQVDRLESLSKLAGRPVILKPEHRQRTGSFKIRGAYNRISRLPDGLPVVAASAGNHAQGVALAASLTGRPATIFMPRNAALPKVAATRDYGATVRLEGEVVDDCIALAEGFAAETGAVYVPPFDDLEVIAGQGTIGLELLEEAPDAEVIVVPVGGGGLIGGVGAAVALSQPPTASRQRPRVVGVEAAGAPTLTEALSAGRPVTLQRLATMADGISVSRCSDLTLSLADRFVDEIVTVDEEEISQAMLLLVERAKAVVEPSGAASLAAILNRRLPGAGPAVAVLSGGNVDPLLLTKLIEHGLAAAGRYLTLSIVMADRVGALAALTTELARLRLNVLDVEHHRSGRDLAVAEVEVQVTVETRDLAHHDEVVAALTELGY